MKRSMLLLIIAGSSFAAAAQVNPNSPDTSSRFNNSTMPDSTRYNMNNPASERLDSAMTTPLNNRLDSVSVTMPATTDTVNSFRTDPANPAVDSATLRSEQNANMNSGTVNTTTADSTSMKTEQNSSMNTTTVDSASMSSDRSTVPEVSATPVTSNNTSSTEMGRGVNNSSTAVTGLNRFSALPVLETWVPAAVVEQLSKKYGDQLYDITMLKTGENQYGYVVRLQENGMYRTETVNDAGAASTNQ